MMALVAQKFSILLLCYTSAVTDTTMTTTTFMAPWTVSGTTWVSRYQKGKTYLDLLEQEIVSGSGISWEYANLLLAPDR